MLPKVKCQVLFEPTADASLPKGLLVANVQDGKVCVCVMNLSEQTIRHNPRCRVAVLSKPQQVLNKPTLEFKEEEGALHVRRVVHIQTVQTSDHPSVPVQVNYEKLSPHSERRLKPVAGKV